MVDPILFQVWYLKQKPHLKQQEVLRHPAKNKIIVCGRRSGKTQMIAAELIRGAVTKEYRRQIVIAPIFKQSLIVFTKILDIMSRSGRHDTDIRSVSRSPYPKVTFVNGSYIDFASADNPDSLRGEAYDRVFLDESAFIRKHAMDVIRPLTFDTGAPIWETTTPFGKGELWERWLRGQNDPNWATFHYNYKDNPYLDLEGVQEIEKDIEEHGEASVYVQCEIYGNFMSDIDSYFTSALVEAAVMDYPTLHGVVI